MPRPSLSDQGVLEELCKRIICGESVHRICRDETMPSERAVYYAMAFDENVCRNIARAREAQQDFYAEQTIEIADNPDIEPDRARVMIAARQWHAGKLAPKKYGDLHRHVGADGGAIVHKHTRSLDISGLEDDQLDALETALRSTVLQLTGENNVKE